jgi:hypothetical protein
LRIDGPVPSATVIDHQGRTVTNKRPFGSDSPNDADAPIAITLDPSGVMSQMWIAKLGMSLPLHWVDLRPARLSRTLLVLDRLRNATLLLRRLVRSGAGVAEDAPAPIEVYVAAAG